MKCDCKDWTENIGKVNGPGLLQAARAGFTPESQYTGVTFRFCPWCSKQISDETEGGDEKCPDAHAMTESAITPQSVLSMSGSNAATDVRSTVSGRVDLDGLLFRMDTFCHHHHECASYKGDRYSAGCDCGFKDVKREITMMHTALESENLSLRESNEKLKAQLAVREMFPIQDGPSVPWEVMVPHEARAKANHGGQTLSRLAERGGLGAGEAWCVVNGIELGRIDKAKWVEFEKAWIGYAERINLRWDELNNLSEENAKLKANIQGIVDSWNQNSGRFFESMGGDNPRLQFLEKAIESAKGQQS